MKRIFNNTRGKLLLVIVATMVVVLVACGWGVYALLVKDNYYSVNVEVLQRGNKTAMQAFEREALLRRNAEERYVAEVEVTQELKTTVYLQTDSLGKATEKVKELQAKVIQLQAEKLKWKHEKDSILRVYNNLQRIDN